MTDKMMSPEEIEAENRRLESANSDFISRRQQRRIAQMESGQVRPEVGRTYAKDESQSVLDGIVARRREEMLAESDGVERAGEKILGAERFAENFPDIADNDRLADIARAANRSLARIGYPRSFDERYQDIGNAMGRLMKREDMKDAFEFASEAQLADAVLEEIANDGEAVSAMNTHNAIAERE